MVPYPSILPVSLSQDSFRQSESWKHLNHISCPLKVSPSSTEVVSSTLVRLLLCLMYRKALTGLSVYIQKVLDFSNFFYGGFPLYTLNTFYILNSEIVPKDTGRSSTCASSGCDFCRPVCQGGCEFQEGEQLAGSCFPMVRDNCPLHKTWLRALEARKII